MEVKIIICAILFFLGIAVFGGALTYGIVSVIALSKDEKEARNNEQSNK